MLRRTMIQSLATAWALLPFPAWARSETGSYRLMQGPMVGATWHERVWIWTRASARSDVSIAFSEREDMSGARQCESVAVGPENDYVARLELSGLQPSTRYFYRVLIGGAPDRYASRHAPSSFATAPRPGARADIKIAFGSCARIQAHPVQPIWDAVAAAQPDMFLWLGDNVYHDTLEPRIMDEMWRMQRNVPNLQPILRSVSNLAIWDDHDFGLNDHDRENPVKEAALASFTKYWANPAAGLPDAPGVFFKHAFGPVDLFMTDGRYYRDPNEAPDENGKTFLGARQMQWLKDELRSSRAAFKLIACGSGWSNAKGPGGDSWAACLSERNALFDFIRDERIAGVVLLSGDTHVGELNAIPWSERGGYDLYDLVSSPLAQETEASWVARRPEIRIRQVYARDVNFGLLQVPAEGELRLVFRLVNSRGQDAFEPFTVHAADLRNGVRSWDRLIDATSRRRQARWRDGGDYYAD